MKNKKIEFLKIDAKKIIPGASSEAFTEILCQMLKLNCQYLL